MLTVSIVIPAHDEAEVIGECLESVAAQSIPVDECIVVDNNCSDRTMDIVRTYCSRLPIQVIEESRQGVAWARDTGFAAASGQVIGRIDADTRIDPEWCARLVGFLADHDDVAAVTGADRLYDAPFEERLTRSAHKAALRFGDGREATTLAGNNMAIRRDAWTQARANLRNEPGTHEDIDLYYALRHADRTVWMLPAMTAAVSARRFRLSPWANRRYQWAAIRTSWVHGHRARAVVMSVQSPLTYLGLSVWWLLIKPYDPELGNWRPWRLFQREHSRREPMTTGD